MQTKDQNDDGQEPVFYKPKILNLVSTLTNVYAWINLIFAFLYLGIRLSFLDREIMGFSSPPLIAGHWWEWENFASEIVMQVLPPIIVTTLSLIGSFFLFKSISIGLNVLLEIDFNMKSRVEETENG